LKWKLSDEKYLAFIMTCFLLKIGPKSSLQLGTVLFSDGWWGFISGYVLENYQHIFIDLLEFLVRLNQSSISSTAKSSKTAENHFTENKLGTTPYLASK